MDGHLYRVQQVESVHDGVRDLVGHGLDEVPGRALHDGGRDVGKLCVINLSDITYPTNGSGQDEQDCYVRLTRVGVLFERF